MSVICGFFTIATLIVLASPRPKAASGSAVVAATT
jgi:hypothetical protein